MELSISFYSVIQSRGGLSLIYLSFFKKKKEKLIDYI